MENVRQGYVLLVDLRIVLWLITATYRSGNHRQACCAQRQIVSDGYLEQDGPWYPP